MSMCGNCGEHRSRCICKIVYGSAHVARLEKRIIVLEQERVPLWSCPKCAFTFDASHTDVDTGKHSCPACAELRLLDAVRDAVLAYDGAETECDAGGSVARFVVAVRHNVRNKLAALTEPEGEP